ncbi:MAG: hypothetical protein ACOVOR_04930 [Rhabdochlamydiaceae bacterium]
MNKQIEIPKEIKRWNWGAFLISPIWCIRHGIWWGLFLLIPILGLFVPFWLGATGNRRLWVKNPHQSVKEFLKRQKRWGLAGLIVWLAVIGIPSGVFLYSTNYSEGIQMALNTINSNKRLVEYFGYPIHKCSFLNNRCEDKMGQTFLNRMVLLDVLGSKQSGHIRLDWEKKGKDWVANGMIFRDSEGGIHQLVDGVTLQGPFLEEVPYEKNRLDKALDLIIKKKEGHLILYRSVEKQDFMITIFEPLDGETVFFSIVYGDGYNRSNKNLYRSKNFIKSKEEVIKIFSLYATGSDAHIKVIEWDQLNSIKMEDNVVTRYVFGENS